MDGLIYEFQVFTIDKTYSVHAAYFTASDIGVMFFDGQNRGIAFVPSQSLDIVRVSPTSKEAIRQVARQVSEFFPQK